MRRIGIVAALVALAAVCASPSSAGFLNGVFSPDGIGVIAVGDSGMVYQSVDGGAVYAKSYRGSARLRAVGSNGLTVLIVGDGGAIHRSTDGGGSWSQQTAAGSPVLLDVTMPAPGVAYAVGDAGTVLRSTDGGANWSAQTSGTSSRLMRVRFLDDQNGWIVGDGGFAAHTTNGGATWTPSGPSTTTTLLGVDQEGTRVWITGTNGACWKSVNSGGNWTPVNLHLDTRADVFNVALQPSDVVYLSGGGGFVRRSTDDGATWTFLKHALLGDAADMQFVGDRGFLASTKSPGVLRTLDAGTNWAFPTGTTITRTWQLKFASGGSNQRGNTLALNGQNRHTIYAGVDDKFYVSRNDGDSWSQFSTLPIGYVKINALVVSPKDSTKMVCAAAPPNAILRSVNGGGNWVSRLAHVFGEYGVPVEMHPDKPDTLYFGGDNDSLYRSINFGLDWFKWGLKNFRSPCDILVVPESDSNVVMVADGVTGSGLGEVWRSIDGGQQFLKVFSNSKGGSEVPSLAMSRLRNTTALACMWGIGGVVRTQNTGVVWDSVSNAITAWGSDFSHDDPNVAVFGTYSGALTYLSLDGGATFSSISISNANYSLYARDRGCILAQQGNGIYKLNSTYLFTPSGSQSVAVTSPNGAEAWVGGAVENVTWNATGLAAVRIEYRRDAGSSWQFVADVPGYLGTYAWTVPDDATFEARVRVRDLWDSAPEDMSDGDFAIIVPTAVAPTGPTFAAWPSAPNPFSGKTLIRYSLARATHVSVDVYNLLGQRVATLVDGNQEPGGHSVTFAARRTDGSSLPAGVYFYRLQAGAFSATHKMLLLR